MPTETEEIESLANQEYKWGFVTDIDAESAPPGLNEEVVRFISHKKGEPQWMLDWRLKAYRHWLTMEEPHAWPMIHYPKIDYQASSYFSAPKAKKLSMDEVDPELLATYEKLGIPLQERQILAGVAVDAVFDSVSVTTTFKDKLGEMGIIFCSFGEAVREHPDLVKKYMGTVVPYSDNYYATLNSAVFTDGSFCYIPKGVKCPMELSTYFRINAKNTGQFERTLKGQRLVILKGAPLRCGMRINCMRRWWSWSRWIMRRSNTARCRTGIPVTRTVKAGFTISSPSAALAAGSTARSVGRRWKPAARSRGNIHRASCRVTTASVNFIRWH
jgi:hypothetical protein